MSDERLCQEGHVVDADKELCSRCNGPVINKEVPADEEILAEAAPEEVAAVKEPKSKAPKAKAKKIEVKKPILKKKKK